MVPLFFLSGLAHCANCFAGTHTRESAQWWPHNSKDLRSLQLLFCSSYAVLEYVTPGRILSLQLGGGLKKEKKKKKCSQDFIKYWKDESHYILPQPEEPRHRDNNSAELLWHYVTSTKDQPFMCEEGRDADTKTGKCALSNTLMLSALPCTQAAAGSYETWAVSAPPAL